MNTYNIGDKIEVIGTGGIYTTYQEMANLMGSKFYKEMRYPSEMSFTIVNKKEHLRLNEMVYLLRNSEGEFLFTNRAGQSEFKVLREGAEEKPKRVKVEYVKVEFASDYEHLKLMIDGERFYTWDGEYEYSFNGARFVGREKPNHLVNAEWSNPKPTELYRRVETPVEWWEDLIQHVENTTEDSGYAQLVRGEKLHVEATMTRDQWRSFARILLEKGE